MYLLRNLFIQGTKKALKTACCHGSAGLALRWFVKELLEDAISVYISVA